MSESTSVAVNYFSPLQTTERTKAAHRRFPTLRTKCANASHFVSPDKERTQDKQGQVSVLARKKNALLFLIS
jgi:hypothetical protein